MNQFTNYDEPFPNSWDPEAVVTHISYQNGALTLHTAAPAADEYAPTTIRLAHVDH